MFILEKWENEEKHKQKEVSQNGKHHKHKDFFLFGSLSACVYFLQQNAIINIFVFLFLYSALDDK